MRYASQTIAFLLGLTIALACGPSLRRTFQSDNAFERCFDFDYNPAKAIDQKRTCWEDWITEHVYNQPPDKVAYAELRLAELERGISIPGPPGPEGAFDERPVPPPPDAGAEQGAPAVGLPDDESADAGADAALAEPLLPAQECEDRCKSSFKPCAEACDRDGAPSCRAACDAGYRGCMRGCFEER